MSYFEVDSIIWMYRFYFLRFSLITLQLNIIKKKSKSFVFYFLFLSLVTFEFNLDYCRIVLIERIIRKKMDPIFKVEVA